MTTEPGEDKVKIAASVMVYAPLLVMRTGIAYLRLKRRVRSSSKNFERGMRSHGMPPETAHRLALSYEGDFRTRTILNRLTGGTFPRGGSW